MNIKIKKIAAKIGLGILIIVALALVVRAVLNFTTGKKLEATLQSMNAKGIPLTLTELETECDPSDNAAFSWKAVEAVFTLVDKEHRELLRDTIEDVFSRRQLDDQKKRQLQEIISGQQDALQLFLEACGKPCFKYEESWDITPSSFKLPDVVKMILMFRLYGVDSYLTAESGQVEEGIEKCLSGMHFLETYLQEPFLMNYLCALANMKVLFVYLQRIVEDFPIDAALMKKIIEKLDPELWRDELLLDFKAERIFAIEAAFSYLDGKLDQDEGKFLDNISIWLFKPFLKSGMANILGTFGEYEKAISLPYFESRDAWNEITQSFEKPFHKQIIGLLFPNFTVVRFKETTLEAMIHSIRLGLGCRIYKEERGNYPESLSELTPGILSTVPVDPFTGKPFIYQIDDTGLKIYSIGNNLKDDQGRGTWMIDRLVMEKDDDWAWIDTKK